MGDFRDIQHGVNDPVDGVDVKRRFNDNQTPDERAQSAADVRSSAIPASDEEFLPEALRRRPTGPLNPRTGRRPPRKQNLRATRKGNAAVSIPIRSERQRFNST
jgi:hypothetical protein